MHAEDKDFKTAYSYFYEAFEALSTQSDARAVLGLKYMLLCKIMLTKVDDIHAIVSGKLAAKYRGEDAVLSMKIVASAYKNRSLKEFEVALKDHHVGKQFVLLLIAAISHRLGFAALQDDPIVRFHLRALYDNLLEQNLIRIIEPFSRVEITHIATLVSLPADQVENK